MLLIKVKMFKVKIGESPSTMDGIFQIDDSSNFKLRKNRGFKPGNPKTVYYGTETIPINSKIKNWVPLSCPCFLCKTHIQNVGFI